jgi:hypothetical protein
MAKLLISSVLIAPALIAYLVVRRGRPRGGFRRTLILAVAFNAAYALCLIYLYFRIS